MCHRLMDKPHHSPLPSILPINVQSFENKMEDLQDRIRYQQDIRDLNVLCLTEMWLSLVATDLVVYTHMSISYTHMSISVFWMDKMAESNKIKGGSVCFYDKN